MHNPDDSEKNNYKHQYININIKTEFNIEKMVKLD